MATNPAPSTKLIINQDLGNGRLLIEVSPDDTITVTCWNGARQLSQPVQMRLSKAPRMRVLVDRVRQALAQQPVTSPYPAPPAPAPWPAPAPAPA